MNMQGHHTFYGMERPVGKLHPVQIDQESLKMLYSKLALAREKSIIAVIFLKWLKNQATDLIIGLKREGPEYR